MMLWDTLIKEAKQLSKDKGFLLIAFLQPIIFIVMFGSSFENGDINHLNTIVMDEDMTQYSSYVVDAINSSEYYDIMEFNGTFQEARDLMNEEEVRGIFRIPKGFGDDISDSKTGHIDVLVDSSIFLVYLSIMGARSEVIGDTLYNISEDVFSELESEKDLEQGKVDDIRDDLTSVEDIANNLNKKFEDFRSDVEEIDIDSFDDDISDLKDGLDDEHDGMRDVRSGIDSLQNVVATIQVLGLADEVTKNLTIESLNNLSDAMSEIISANDDIRDGVNDINISSLDFDGSIDELVDIFEGLNSTFMNVKNKSDSVGVGFDRLQKDFLVEPVSLDTEELYGKTTYFDYLGAGVLSLIVFFICLLAPALNVIAEKESNTLYRLSTTPASTISVFMGKFLLFLIFGFIEMAYTLFLAIFLYDLRITGSIYAVVTILTLLACASISIGLFVSSKVSTMQQALVIVPVLVIPSFLISNSFFPPDIMPDFMDYLSKITPMTFSNHALNNVMIKGFSLSFVWSDVMMLFLFIVVPLALFIWSYRRIRY